MSGAKAHYDVGAFSETDLTDDLKIIDVPATLVMHGDDDQIVPIADSALLSATLLKNARLKGLRDIPARHVHDARRRVNPDLLALHHELKPCRRPQRGCSAAEVGVEGEGKSAHGGGPRVEERSSYLRSLSCPDRARWQVCDDGCSVNRALGPVCASPPISDVGMENGVRPPAETRLTSLSTPLTVIPRGNGFPAGDHHQPG